MSWHREHSWSSAAHASHRGTPPVGAAPGLAVSRARLGTRASTPPIHQRCGSSHGSRCWPVTSRPRSSRRVNALRSGRSKAVLSRGLMDGVGISIIERFRPLHNHDTPNPTHHTYTLQMRRACFYEWATRGGAALRYVAMHSLRRDTRYAPSEGMSRSGNRLQQARTAGIFPDAPKWQASDAATIPRNTCSAPEQEALSPSVAVHPIRSVRLRDRVHRLIGTASSRITLPSAGRADVQQTQVGRHCNPLDT